MPMKRSAEFKVLINLFILVVILITAFICYTKIYIPHEEKTIHENVDKFINEELSFEEKTYDLQLAKILRMISLKHISDSDKGHLYERAAQIYKFQGDTLNFYHTMGCALYYLELSGNDSVAVNIYEDIANYYVADHNYQKARIFIQKADSVCDISEIDDPQVKSYAYRMQAIISRAEKDTTKAREYIRVSNEIVDQNTDNFWHDSYVAINTVVLAGIELDDGNIEEAKLLNDRINGSDFFNATFYADIVARDLLLPYYDNGIKIAAINKDEQGILQLLDEMDEYSKRFGFYKFELETVLDLLKNESGMSDTMIRTLRNRLLELYENIVTEQSEDYAAMIDSPLNNGIEEQRQLRYSKEVRSRRIKIVTIELLLVCVIVTVLVVVIRHNLTDPLTQIGNRRALDYYQKLLSVFGQKMSVIMLDVDNFKKINDTYGHDKGDVVLINIGKLLKAFHTRNNRAFRYGGEEFVMVIRSTDINVVLRIAENLRRDIELQTWEFDENITVSLGVATRQVGEDVIKKADENMYYSKTHGKNCVSYSQNGEKTVFRNNRQ